MDRTHLLRAGSAAVVALALSLATPAAGITSPASTTHPTAVPAATDGRLVFNDYATGQLYTSNPDGSALVQVTHLKDSAAQAAQWSPDSSRIAYHEFTADGPRIYEINTDGTGRHLVFDETPGYSDFTPSYTADGQRIVFARCKPDPPGGCAVYSVRTDGSDLQAITRFGRGDRSSFVFSTDVSPDGAWVAFNRFGWKGFSLQTWIVRVDGTEAHPVTQPRLVAGNPGWSPSGGALYVQAGRLSGLGLHVFRIPVTRGRVTQLTFTDFPNGDFNPGSSPSGRQVAFISDRTHSDLCCQDLYLMNADGSGQHIVDTGLSLPGNPDWGSAQLQTGPSVRVPQPSASELAAGRARIEQARHPWEAAHW